MQAVTSISDEERSSLRERAVRLARASEAQVRAIVGDSEQPEGQKGLGTLLTEIGRDIQLTDEEFAVFVERKASPSRSIDLE